MGNYVIYIGYIICIYIYIGYVYIYTHTYRIYTCRIHTYIHIYIYIVGELLHGNNSRLLKGNDVIFVCLVPPFFTATPWHSSSVL